MKKQGAEFVAGEDWAPNVVVSGRLITGQNPGSSTPCAEAVVSALQVAVNGSVYDFAGMADVQVNRSSPWHRDLLHGRYRRFQRGRQARGTRCARGARRRGRR